MSSQAHETYRGSLTVGPRKGWLTPPPQLLKQRHQMDQTKA